MSNRRMQDILGILIRDIHFAKLNRHEEDENRKIEAAAYENRVSVK
jgi:hypothetical protein